MTDELTPEQVRVARNTDLWNSVFVTDPSAVKAITGKPYKGNSPKPYWLIWRATETFGPCGQGWGISVKSESFFRMSDTDVMHSCVVCFWYTRDGARCEIEQMGQTKACYMSSKNVLIVDEDAGKKSVTDGMVKCMSMVGFAGDIFSGQWDDSGYVQWAAEQFGAPVRPVQQKAGVKNDPREGIGDDMPEDWKTFLRDLGEYASALVAEGKPGEAHYVIEKEKLEGDQKTWLWSQMDSKTRAALKLAATVAR